MAEPAPAAGAAPAMPQAAQPTRREPRLRPPQPASPQAGDGEAPAYATPRACAASRASSASTSARCRAPAQGPHPQGGRRSAREGCAAGARGGPRRPRGGGLNLAPWPKVDFAKFGPIERKPLSRIQKISAANLHRNWVMIPHVTQYDEADITELEAFRKRMNRTTRSGRQADDARLPDQGGVRR